MLKKYSVLFFSFLFIILCFTNMAVGQEGKSLGFAQVIYQWGEIAIEEQFSTMADRPYKIGVSLPHVKSEFWINNAYGIIEEAKNTGCKSVTILGSTGYEDLSTQINQVENLIELGVDAILIAPIDSIGNIESCRESIKRGIPIFFLQQFCELREHSGQVIANDFQLGQMQAEWLVRKLEGKGKVILLSGPAAQSWTSVNYQGIESVFSHYPGIEIIEQRWSDVDPALGMEVTERYLMAHPEVDAFICADVLGHGCAQAIRAAGKEKDIYVVMNYPEAATLPMIRQGLIDYSVFNAPVSSARILMSAVNRVLNDPDSRIVGANFFVEPIEITPENVNEIDLSEVLAPEDWSMPFGTIDFK